MTYGQHIGCVLVMGLMIWSGTISALDVQVLLAPVLLIDSLHRARAESEAADEEDTFIITPGGDNLAQSCDN